MVTQPRGEMVDSRCAASHRYQRLEDERGLRASPADRLHADEDDRVAHAHAYAHGEEAITNFRRGVRSPGFCKDCATRAFRREARGSPRKEVMMKMRATKLFAVMALCAGPARAEVSPLALAPQPQPARPTTLATGAPACGNTMSKYVARAEDPMCAVIRINEDLADKGRQAQRELDAQRYALTRDLLRRLGF
jgi:hypothetical protein